MLTYKTASMITAVLCITLFVFLLFIPEPIFIIFGVTGNESAYFLSRRASMLFAGYAAISFFSRNTPHSDARRAISLGLALSMFGFSILGLFEFVRGFAGAGILLPFCAEIYLAFVYFSIWRKDNEGQS